MTDIFLPDGWCLHSSWPECEGPGAPTCWSEGIELCAACLADYRRRAAARDGLAAGESDRG